MIKIVSSDMCPYCDMAKNLLTSLDIKYEVIDITWHPEKIVELSTTTWMRTVPQIFNGEVSKQNLLWGYDEIKTLHDKWELLKIIK